MTHVKPAEFARSPTTTNMFGRSILVPFPALCGVELIGGRDCIDWSFVDRFTGVLCPACLNIARPAGQLRLEVSP